VAVSLLGGSQTGLFARICCLAAAEVAKAHPKRGVGDQVEAEDLLRDANALSCVTLKKALGLVGRQLPFENQARHVPKDGLFADQGVVGLVAKAIDLEDAAIFVNGETVRPSVIFGGNAPFRTGRDAQDAAIWDVGDIKVAGAIEARSFKEGMKLIVALPEGPAGPAILDAQPLRKFFSGKADGLFSRAWPGR